MTILPCPFLATIAMCSFNVICLVTRDWGSPLGKEFTNVGEGFCFSDAVQRSRSPINIDHNHHKKSSVLPHHKSSSQSGGPGRSHGRDGGEGPDDGLGGIGGGAHGQKGDPGMQGMGRYQSGEGEGGQHHYRPSSSSSSSHHHVNVGNASKTTTSNSHGALHVDTTGTELDSSSSRRGPQTSGSRGMNRGTMGESDMLVSQSTTPLSLYLPPLCLYLPHLFYIFPTCLISSLPI